MSLPTFNRLASVQKEAQRKLRELDSCSRHWRFGIFIGRSEAHRRQAGDFSWLRIMLWEVLFSFNTLESEISWIMCSTMSQDMSLYVQCIGLCCTKAYETVLNSLIPCQDYGSPSTGPSAVSQGNPGTKRVTAGSCVRACTTGIVPLHSHLSFLIWAILQPWLRPSSPSHCLGLVLCVNYPIQHYSPPESCFHTVVLLLPPDPGARACKELQESSRALLKPGYRCDLLGDALVRARNVSWNTPELLLQW